MIVLTPNLCQRDPRIMPVNTAATTTALDGTTTRHAMVFVASKTGSISTAQVFVNTLSSSQTVKISIQSVSAGGNPSGTVLASGTGTPVAGSYLTITFSSALAVTEGNQYALVVEWNATAGSITLATNTNFALPIYLTYASATWTTQSGVWLSCLLGYSDGTYPSRMGLMVRNATANAISTTSSAKEAALKWIPEANYRLVGMYFYGYLRDCLIQLRDASDAVLNSNSLPTNFTTNTTDRMVYIPLTPYQLVAGTTYRLCITPNSATTSQIYQINTQALIFESFGMETTARYSGRGTIGGSWSDPTSAYPAFIPVYDAIMLGSGSSGWNGGING